MFEVIISIPAISKHYSTRYVSTLEAAHEVGGKWYRVYRSGKLVFTSEGYAETFGNPNWKPYDPWS